MYEFETFRVPEMMEVRSKLRGLFEKEADTIEDAAQRVVEFFRSEFVDEQQRPACALVRVYKTHPFAQLDDECQRFVRAILPEADTVPGLRCLVLLATAGDIQSWNSRHLSRNHKAIPLSSEKAVQQAPMIAQLIHQFGIETSTVLRPDPSLLLEAAEKPHNVFFVPKAEGSPFIVAQYDFVKRYKIVSVIGFGGVVATGDLFAAILFSRVTIPTAAAEAFKVIGLNFKLAMLSASAKPLFRD